MHLTPAGSNGTDLSFQLLLNRKKKFSLLRIIYFVLSEPLILDGISLKFGLIFDWTNDRKGILLNITINEKTREPLTLWRQLLRVVCPLCYFLDEEPPFCFGRHGVVFRLPFSWRLANRMAMPAAKVVRKIVAVSLAKVCRKSIGISPPFPF